MPVERLSDSQLNDLLDGLEGWEKVDGRDAIRKTVRSSPILSMPSAG